MADLRIVDAPVLLQESITDDVKMPTGGLGNFSIRLGDIVWYVVTKERLANKNYVDLSSKGVKDKLDNHIADKANPHQVTKEQVGLGNVDNTADTDKPVSNAVNSAIITATSEIDDALSLKASVTYVDSKDGDLTTLKTTDKTNLVKAINEVYDNTNGVVSLYDKNVAAGAGANGWAAELIVDKSGATQQQVNYNGGSKWHSRVGGYALNERVVLASGDIVKSTVDGNVNDPNVDMTGWINTSSAQLIIDDAGNRVASVNIENIADLLNVSFAKSAFVRSHHDGNRLGTGIFNWSESTAKSLHDGGRIIDPLKLTSIPTDWANLSDVTSWLVSDNVGNGCWVRDKSHTPTIFDYGFTPNSLLHKATNTLLFQKLVDNNIVSRVPVYDAPLYVTNGINVKNGRRIFGDSDYMGEPLLANPDRGIIGDGSGAVFTTGKYPATANTNRQLHFKSVRVRNTTYPCLDILHSDDFVLDDCAMYTTGGTAVRQFYSARVRYLGGRYASSFTAYSDDNFAMRIYDNCNGTWISPTTVIAGGTNGGAVDVTKSQKVVLDGIIETNGGFGCRVGGYAGGDLPLWQPNTAYSRGDRVKNTTNAWVCGTSHTSADTFKATNWEVTNGNCNAVTVNGYYETTNRPVSIGANNLVLGAKLGTSSLYVGGTNSPNPKFSIELGAVSGLSLGGGVSLHKKGTEPTFRFAQPTSGSSITDYLTNSTIKNFHVQGGGPDFENGLTNQEQIGLLFARNEIKLNANAIVSGRMQEYITPLISANAGMPMSAFIIATGNGGEINAIEIIEATGAIGCTIRVGRTAADGENLAIDPSTLTLSNGAAVITPLLFALIRPNQQQVIRVIAGTGTGSFRVRIKYRM